MCSLNFIANAIFCAKVPQSLPKPSSFLSFCSNLFLSAIFVFTYNTLGIVVNRKSSKLPYPIYFYFDFQTFEWQKRAFSKESSSSIKDFFQDKSIIHLHWTWTWTPSLNTQSSELMITSYVVSSKMKLPWAEYVAPRMDG